MCPHLDGAAVRVVVRNRHPGLSSPRNLLPIAQGRSEPEQLRRPSPATCTDAIDCQAAFPTATLDLTQPASATATA